MELSAFRYAPYDEVDGIANVVVDGAPNAGTVLTISHWPGMSVPAGCEADTSAQMAFRYLDRGADLHGDAAVVTNNHFDQDGLAGVYALVRPEEAMGRRRLLEGLATAGDFAVLTDRTAARLSMAVAALADDQRSPIHDLPSEYDRRCAVLYGAALELLPGWLDDPDSCRELWAVEDDELERALVALRSGAVAVHEDVELDLAVVTLPTGERSAGHRFVGRQFDGIHPMALHLATERSTILVVDPAGARHQLTCRYEGWVQFRSRTIRPRVDLRPLAEALTEADSSGAVWDASPPSDLTPQLQPALAGPPSALDPPALVEAVTRHLRTAPPAWDPFATD